MGMLYPIGTRIDLRPVTTNTEPEVSRLYVPGTKVFFVKMIESFTVLNITKNPLAI